MKLSHTAAVRTVAQRALMRGYSIMANDNNENYMREAGTDLAEIMGHAATEYQDAWLYIRLAEKTQDIVRIEGESIWADRGTEIGKILIDGIEVAE